MTGLGPGGMAAIVFASVIVLGFIVHRKKVKVPEMVRRETDVESAEEVIEQYLQEESQENSSNLP